MYVVYVFCAEHFQALREVDDLPNKTRKSHEINDYYAKVRMKNNRKRKKR